ncbi:FKBP-type peptidyl-prolyl cis-trans isomerase fkpA precursor [Serratia ficaria]|uniref:FKBP-type peptidyl-prolyl cis-trans isomerase N-terminal domain-containing protein n=1 Tax=Serratia ficaria TaxID=61651 RepID=UPI002179E253|nr:FKBP-type peptidyl-prolyl cis-trans isomerase N-terminal domain-containing protein [Serratia ficaria]CAI1708359.1 FKBP-type peptidyl-prolyl cis-trans isomerase fkpA precursor [Serratia ficaria]
MALKGKLSLLILAFIPCVAQADSYSWVHAGAHSQRSPVDTSRFFSAPTPLPDPPARRQPENSLAEQMKRKDRQIAQLKKKLAQEQGNARRQTKKLQQQITQLKNADAIGRPQRKTTLSPAGPALNAAVALLSPLPGSLARSLGISIPDVVAAPGAPLREEQKVDYATGMLLGKNILLMQQRNQALNIKMDNRIVLAGIDDYLNNASRLSESEGNSLLEETESALQEAAEAYAHRYRQEGAKYVEKFIKRAGAHRAPTGFYYRVDRRGGGKIPTKARVDIQVKESLTNGTIINDMTRSGAVISQQLSDYPPLFQDALSLVGKQGAITLVVPPELAYGDSGNPPSIPPGATMIYELQVVSVAQ